MIYAVAAVAFDVQLALTVTVMAGGWLFLATYYVRQR